MVTSAIRQGDGKVGEPPGASAPGVTHTAGGKSGQEKEMIGHPVRYHWRVALFLIGCVGLLGFSATMWVILPILYEPVILFLTVPVGGCLVFMIGIPLLTDSSEWAFQRRYLSQEHRDYVMALRWANEEFPGPREDPWTFGNHTTRR